MATTLPGAATAAEDHPESDVQRRGRLRTVVAASLLGTTVEWYDFFLYATCRSSTSSPASTPPGSPR